MHGEAADATLMSTVRLVRLAERVVVVVIGLALLLTAYAKMGGRADDTVAQGNLAAVLPLVHAYAVDHGGYGGMTLDALRQGYSPSLDTHTYLLVERGAADFCLESTYAGRTWRVNSSQGKPSPGGCKALGPSLSAGGHTD